MAHTNQTVDSIGSGTRFEFTAVNESYYVADGVLVQSTDNAIVYSGFDGARIEVDGIIETLASSGIVMNAERIELLVGRGGVVRTLSEEYTTAAVLVFGSDAAIENLGQISAEGSVGVVSTGTSLVSNSGLINAASPVLINRAGAGGDTFENFGRVTATAANDDLADFQFNNGVVAQGAFATVINHRGAVISAVSSEGAGIALTAGGNNSEILNDGRIGSTLWYGVDFFNLDGQSSASLENNGMISGGTGAFRGNETADFVVNAGIMRGDLVLNGGDDILKGASGKIFGDVSGGDGDDVLRTGKGNQAIDGGADDDILDGGKGRDQLLGGTGSDRFVFASGYGKDEISDFASGTDLIDLSDWKAIKNFNDLLSHSRDKSGDVWITAGHDILIIDNASKNTLAEADFLI